MHFGVSKFYNLRAVSLSKVKVEGEKGRKADREKRVN
jgi:hypothetical protein